NIDESYRKYADKLLIDKGIAESDFVVGINPNAFKQACQWGVDRFISLSNKILEIYNAKIIIIGSEGERTLVEMVVNEVKNDNCIALTGLGLIQLSAVISKFHIFITNDTGPMHLAAAVKTPVVAIIGQDPKRYAPYIPDAIRRILYVDNLPCRPCNKFDCKEKLCLDPISVDMVWEKFKSLADNILRMRNGNKK
ncbi:MAG: glycosyltransferase family 9 protein, partial [Candidatus Kuenenia sp.]|nr:glycosyltransferase family 9 protein [Candidatus Kuenenia sp.]